MHCIRRCLPQKREQLALRKEYKMARLRHLCFAISFLGAVPALAQPNVLRIVPQADLVNLDPGLGSNLITREYGLMVYEELFAWDSHLQPRPMMVERWFTSPDSLVWQFTLRPGLKFHDGQEVTTADVLNLAIKKDRSQWSKGDTMRIGSILQRLGWQVSGRG